MKLFLLGTGTCNPNPKRGPACYFLSSGPIRFLIDPGPGACHRAISAGLNPYDIESIILTHHHLDHSGDLMPYLFNFKHLIDDEPKRDVKIIAPIGFTDVFEKLMEVYGNWISSDDYSIHIEEMGDTSWEGPGITIRSKPMAHGANAVGYRFEKKGGPSFVFSGDTGFCEELIDLAGGADLLLVECSFPDGQGVEGHMTPTDVAQTGIHSGVKKIVLTHFYPMVDTANAVDKIRSAGYSGEIVVGEDGMIIDI